MSNALYILLTVILVIVYPVVQYRVVSEKWKRISFWTYLPFALAYTGVTVFLVFGSLKTNRTLEAVRDYSAVARLDALGNPPGAGIGSDIKVNTELVGLLADTYQVKGDQIFMNRDSDAEQRYRTVIQKFPKFPFGHYYLTLCLRDRNDESWRQHAERTVEIFSLTTQIDGHNTNHDEVMKKVSAWLNTETGTEPAPGPVR